MSLTLILPLDTRKLPLVQYATAGNLQPFSDLITDLGEKQIREYMSLLPKESI